MPQKPGQLIEDAQAELHRDIYAALATFTEKTGLGADLSSLFLCATMGESGNTIDTAYYGLRTTLVTSMGG